MKDYSNKTLATSLTSLVFLVVGISGVMLYMHWFNSNVKEVHEILGLVFVAAALFHVFFNFGAMKRYFSNKTFLASLVVVLGVSLAFIIPTIGESKGGDPKKEVFESVFKSDIKTVFIVLNVDYEKAKKNLEVKGIDIDKYSNIDTISKENKMSPFEVIQIVKE